MTEPMTFVVRPLPGVGIDGCFRVHLAPDSLEKLGLRLGDVCCVANADGIVGAAIAWRATDQMGANPKLRPAKFSEPLRNLLGLKEGSNITISKASGPILHADEVTLIDVTAPTDAAPVDDQKWRTRCSYSMANYEAIAWSLTFDVAGKKGTKKRFSIKEIRSSTSTQGNTALYYCDDNTKIVIGTHDDIPNRQSFEPTGPLLGGLDEQINHLRERLQCLTKPLPGFPTTMARNQHILLHGYEGTGKSALLDHVAGWKMCPTFRVEPATSARAFNQSHVQQIIKQALDSQPSLILIDDLDHLVPTTDGVSARALSREFDKLRDSTVLAIAAARSISGTHSSMHAPDTFSILMELSVPDIMTRRQIFNARRGIKPDEHDSLSETVSAKTHGFTARDLALLHNIATEISYSRWNKSQFLRQDAPSDEHQDEHDDLQVELQDYESALRRVRPTALREVFFEKPKTTWSDIGGSDTIRKRFDEIIGWPLKRAEMMKKHNIRPVKGVLLYGPPGCSKTLTAQAVASSYDLNFIAIKGAELISMYVGESERAVREVFRKARQAAPCIIFFDEIDSIGGERGGSAAKDLNVLTTLLNEMDGFDEMKDVTVLAATNKPETIDPALMRPGRFDAHFFIGPPTATARQEIFNIKLKTDSLAAGVDLAQLVEETAGYSGAEIVSICELAQTSALRREIETSEETSVQFEDFEAALSKVPKGITPAMMAVYASFQGRGE